jgi:hypothetical protein
MTNLRLRARVNFPANVTASGGLGVAKTAGQWDVHPEWDDLALIDPVSLPDPATQQVWVWNPTTNVYSRLSLYGLSANLTILHSSTSTTIGTGSKTFTVEPNKSVSVGQTVVITENGNPSTNYMTGLVTAYSGTTFTVNVANAFGAGTYAGWTISPGGATGPAGPQGTPGNDAGFKYGFNSATAGDPGSGKFLLNNTFGSATTFSISKTDGDGNALGALLATLGNSTSPQKCLVVLSKIGAVALMIGYITSAPTDNGTYDTYSFTPILTTGSIINGDNCRATFYRVGDKGADGAGSGNVITSGAPTVNQFGIWVDSTHIQGLSLTGLVKGNGASAPTAGVAGTDYLAPAAIGTTVQAFDAQLTSTIRQNSQSANYTTVLTDGEKHILHPASDNNARTFTIDSNANVAYPIGTAITFVNKINTVTIAITADTLTLAGGGAGSRTLAANGMATALKIATTEWMISGSGLS